MAAAVRQRVAFATTADVSTHTLTFGSSPLTGSILICCAATAAGAPAVSPDPPSGWTVRVENTSGAENAYLWDKTATGSETGITYVQTGASASVAWLYEITGITAADVWTGNFTTSSATCATGNTAATTAANDWVFAFSNSTSTAVTLSSFTALALTIDVQAPSTGSAANIAAGVGFGVPGNTSGATLATTATWSGAADHECLIVGYKVGPTARPGLPTRRFWRAAHRSANI